MSVILQIMVLILSATLHEASHGYVAYALGDPTAKYEGRLTLNPIKHLDLFGSIILPALMYLSSGGSVIFGWAKPVPYNPDNLKAGKWGPASNLLLAFVFGMVVRFAGSTLSVSFISLVGLIVFINVLLAVFNLLPVPPLDGSKLLFALLPASARNIEEFFHRYQLFILLFVLFFGWRIIAYPVNILSSLLLGL